MTTNHANNGKLVVFTFRILNGYKYSNSIVLSDEFGGTSQIQSHVGSSSHQSYSVMGNIMILKKGTVVKVNGIPFELMEDVEVIGTEENLELASIE